MLESRKVSMPAKPRIRAVEMFPLNDDAEGSYVLRDPSGLASTVVLPPAVAVLISLMNGRRTLDEICDEFKHSAGQRIAREEVEHLVAQLEELHFLESARFAEYERQQGAAYLALQVRPSAHAGGAYHGEPGELRLQLGELFTCPEGPGLLPWEGNGRHLSEQQGRLCGVISPHIDFRRGGASFAWAYDRVVTESQAKVFVILGTAHTPLKSFYSISRKDFDTPLGTTHTNREFVDALANRLGSHVSMFSDELPHRHEHSIEFQALMLQFVLGGRRDFTIVPILVGSFHPFVNQDRLPLESTEVADFIAALRDTAGAWPKEVCLIGGVDMAHIGPQFGDPDLLDDTRLKLQWTDDQQLLAKALAGDAAAWFRHVGQQGDANRICGLAPMYTLLETLQPQRGELLKYDQAVAEDRSSCVSFAAAAFYE